MILLYNDNVLSDLLYEIQDYLKNFLSVLYTYIHIYIFWNKF